MHVSGISLVILAHPIANAKFSTPWLITRRRTCPICKGDVVRSLARGSPSSPRYEPYNEDDESDEDIESQPAGAINDSQTAALPIERPENEDDGSPGEGSSTSTPSQARGGILSGSWRNLIAGSLGSSSRSPRSTPHDRDR